jgi:hypothetical protein
VTSIWRVTARYIGGRSFGESGGIISKSRGGTNRRIGIVSRLVVAAAIVVST